MFNEIVVHIFYIRWLCNHLTFLFQKQNRKNTGNNKELIRKIKIFFNKDEKTYI